MIMNDHAFDVYGLTLRGFGLTLGTFRLALRSFRITLGVFVFALGSFGVHLGIPGSSQMYPGGIQRHTGGSQRPSGDTLKLEIEGRLQRNARFMGKPRGARGVPKSKGPRKLRVTSSFPGAAGNHQGR